MLLLLFTDTDVALDGGGGWLEAFWRCSINEINGGHIKSNNQTEPSTKHNTMTADCVLCCVYIERSVDPPLPRTAQHTHHVPDGMIVFPVPTLTGDAQTGERGKLC
jgi:hypothetical protein